MTDIIEATEGGEATPGQKLALRVAEYIELFPESYDQGSWGTADGYLCATAGSVLRGLHCGASACVAGWAVRLSADEMPDYELGQPVEAVAQRLLGLDIDDAEWLFSGGRRPTAMPGILRQYAATGFVGFVE